MFRDLRVISNRVRSLFHPSREDDELARELAFHLEQQATENRERGMDPEAARAAAMRALGGVSQVADECRDARGTRVLEHLAADLRIAFRMLLKSPVTSSLGILSLAIAIGPTAVLFSIVNAVLLKPLPVENPKQLVSLVRKHGAETSEALPFAVFLELARQRDLLGDVVGFSLRSTTVGNDPNPARVLLASDGYFSGLRVHAQSGTTWRRGERAQIEEPSIVISGRFQRSHRVSIGSSLYVNKHSFAVIGILPDDFTGTSLDDAIDIWVPIDFQPLFDRSSLLHETDNWVRVVSRLGPGQSAERAAAVASAVLQQFQRQRAVPAPPNERVIAVDASRPALRVRTAIANPLIFVWGIVSLVLVISCVNIANLQLARVTSREKEFAMRVALGATRGRLIQQLLTESALISFFAGATGLVLAAMIQDMFRARVGAFFALPEQVVQFRIDAPILAFTTGLVLIVGLLFGTSPAWSSTRFDLVPALKEGPVGVGVRFLRREALTVSQVAITVLLLITAAVLGAGLRRSTQADLGFDSSSVTQIQFDWRNRDAARIRQLASTVAERMRQTAGIEAAAVTAPPMLSRSSLTANSLRRADDPQRKQPVIHVQIVSSSFFAAMRIPLLDGHGFSESDSSASPKVAILSRSAARAYFPGEDAPGRMLFFEGNAEKLQVIGVCADVNLQNTAPAEPVLYLPFDQADVNPQLITIEVRGPKNATAPQRVRQLVASIDPQLRAEAAPMSTLIRESLYVQQLGAWSTAAFGLLGLFLAVVGVYGLQFYLVQRRTAEIGLRMALGATRIETLTFIWTRAMLPVGLGIVTGVGLAMAASKLVVANLFGVPTAEPLYVLIVVGGVAGIAALATYWPARWASLVSPLIALRHE